MPRLTRPASIAALACVLTVPAVAGCEAGLDAPTLEYHQAASGAYTSADGVMISNAFVLGPGIGQQLPAGGQAGLFVSISSTGGDRLKSASTSAAGSVRLVSGAVNIPATNSPDGGGPADLTGPTPQIILTNLKQPLSGGQSVTVTFTFANAGAINVQVPVEPQAYAYATYQQPPAPVPTPTPTPTTSTTAAHHKNNKNKKQKSKSAKTTAKAKATASPSVSPSAR